MQGMESPTEEDRHDAGSPASSSIPPVLQEVDVMKASREQLAAQRTPLRADGVLKAPMLTITLVHLSPHTKPFYVAKNLHELDAYRLGQHNILPMLGFTGCSKDKFCKMQRGGDCTLRAVAANTDADITADSDAEEIRCFQGRMSGVLWNGRFRQENVD